MWHRIRFLFSSAISPWVALICTPLAIIVNYASRAPYWMGDALLTSEWALVTFYLLTIPVCALTAYDVSRAVGPKSASIVATRVYEKDWAPGLFLINLTLCIVPAAAAYAYTTLFLPTWDRNATAATYQMISGCLGFAVLVLASIFIGRLSSPFTALGIAAVGGLLVNVSALGSGYRFIDYGGSTALLVAFRYTASLVEYRFLLMVVLVIIGTFIVGRHRSLITSWLTYGFLGTIALLTVTALGNDNQRFELNPEYDQVCDVPDHGPATCTYPAHEYLIGSLYRGLDGYARKIETAGVPFPGCMSEAPIAAPQSGNERRATECLVLPASSDLVANAPRDGLPPDAFAGAYLNSLDCPQMRAEQPDEDFSARTGQAFHLLMSILESDSPDETRKLGEEFNRLWKDLQQCR